MFRRFVALLCLLAVTAAMPLGALADDRYTDSVVVEPEEDAGVSRYVFARTGTGWFAENEVDLKIEAGLMSMEGYPSGISHMMDQALYCFPPMEVKVWRWEPDIMQWVLEQNYDIYSERTATVKLEEDDHSYCIQLYFWNPLTVAQSYHKNEKFFNPSPLWMRGCMFKPETAHWVSSIMPAVTATPGDDTRLFRSNPLGYLLPNNQ